MRDLIVVLFGNGPVSPMSCGQPLVSHPDYVVTCNRGSLGSVWRPDLAYCCSPCVAADVQAHNGVATKLLPKHIIDRLHKTYGITPTAGLVAAVDILEQGPFALFVDRFDFYAGSETIHGDPRDKHIEAFAREVFFRENVYCSEIMRLEIVRWFRRTHVNA